MSGFKKTLGKRGAQASLLALVIVAALAVSGIGAASASAACPTEAESMAIEGKGASLQKIAQTEWTGRNVPGALEAIPHAKDEPERGYAKVCPKASVSYTSVGSGAGLKAFGFTGGFMGLIVGLAELNGAGLGASHQTGWTSLVASLIDEWR